MVRTIIKKKVRLSQIDKWIVEHVEFSLANEEFELKKALVQLRTAEKNVKKNTGSALFKSLHPPTKFDSASLKRYIQNAEDSLMKARKGVKEKEMVVSITRVQDAVQEIKKKIRNLEGKEKLHDCLRHLEEHLRGKDKEGSSGAEVEKDIQQLQKCLKGLGFSVRIHDDTMD